MTIRTEGTEEAQAAIDRLMEALKSDGPLDTATEAGAEEGATSAAQLAPRRSGALSRAIGVVSIGQLFGIGIDLSATAPGGGRPYIYGPIVADRMLDFFQQAGEQHAQRIVQRIFDAFTQAAE